MTGTQSGFDLHAPRALFDAEHEDFRASYRSFLTRNVVPHLESWDEDGIIPRAPWQEAGRQGFLSLGTDPDDPQAGVLDFRFQVAAAEESARVGDSSLAAGFAVHRDVVLPYIVDLGTPEQHTRYLGRMAEGAIIGAIAMTEPSTGSDLQGITTHARRDGDCWVLNGAKTFITNGINADVVIVVARTNPDPAAGSRAFSLFLVDRETPGFTRGSNLKKLGLRAQDTAELFFDDVALPHSALLGEEGGGLLALMSHLPMERMSIAVTALAGARAALSWTLDYVKQRKAFGKAIADFQNTQFALAEMVTELEVAQAYVDDAVMRLNQGRLPAVDAAKAKWWTTEMHKRVVDRCLQLFGGYGYMLEYPIARSYADTRVTTIYGGTTEMMKTIIARDLLRPDR